MLFHRHLDQKLKNHFKQYKQVLVLLGPRQVGKTTILKRIFPEAAYLLLDNEPILKAIESYDINVYKQLWGKERYLILDELHLATDPGKVVKIIYDQMPDLKLIVTGSSALDIKNKTGESLAGRKIEYTLFPLTFSEYLFQQEIIKKLDFNIFENLIQKKKTPLVRTFDLERTLENVLIYGLYPEVINLTQDKKYLLNLAESVIFKDILDLKLIEDRRLALSLLKLLAYQVGNLINYSEIANRLSANIRTIKRYIEIFEQSYLIYRIYPFSKKERNAIVKSPKIYFLDNGLRNALINNFDNLDIRSDRGALWENFIFSEILKAVNYLESSLEINYWRLKNEAEVDLILADRKKIIGAEIKFNKGQFSHAFSNRYPKAKNRIITIKNFY